MEQPEVTICKYIVQPGAKLPLHKHPVINAGYLIRGELTVYSENGDSKTLKPGESMIEMVEKWHYGENTGEDVVESIVFYIGEKNQEITIY